MSYQKFASVYDYLMSDVPYDDWMEFTKSHLRENKIKPHKVLDLACGTGEMSLRYVREGWSVTGVDLSEEMLMFAQEKAMNQGASIALFQQDMSQLEGLGHFDLITIFCDSLNYLTDEEQIRSTFQRVHDHLGENGLFMFDVHTPYKMNTVFLGQTYTLKDDDVSYIWDCLPGEWPLSVEHDLTFFAFNEEHDTYDRFDELHIQRTFQSSQYKLWLEEAELEILSVSYDFFQTQPTGKAERTFFVCRKKSGSG
ncbi:class I SAM-dependent DNA methyltransferase [Bacillus sp. 2205SS5-2]|uniref:class I SAM-dependent DNA methyltransferase n=1 Tax=Bacillus sp. 2205SS5-2 TaxID=3109031 RepID=UPI003003D103